MNAKPSSEFLYQAYKPLLFSLAYRMLGSVMDAEDIVQEAFLYWSEVEPQQVENEKAYLCKIVTNRCVDRLRSASKQREVYVGPWLPEPLMTDILDRGSPSSVYLHKESLSTAYLLLLQQLTWVERAVFVLREVLQYEYDEISEIVGKSSTNCRQIFHRAKRAVSGLSDSVEAERPKSESLMLRVEQFVQALASGNAGQLVSLLKADATLYSDGGGKVTAAIRPILGAERISLFLFGLMSKMPEDFSYRIVSVNDQPAIVSYFGTQPNNVITFQIEDGLITDIYIVINPDKLLHLPPLS
ncbi:RNA polymerase sigma-70 factor [Cohnella silvisoli]|uniref:RNA polymerase sigma-70 factor n=1 Tax=Cohnella silvisoli TaxID=2873699 RepID=A0ABV1KKW2_9BACL|nr:RNA polymerase sigma-70 factor [Cohnella silvisoli]MCD9020867.1 RNA polymerase sigma-70 factor [Cohnella silvisoli]